MAKPDIEPSHWQPSGIDMQVTLYDEGDEIPEEDVEGGIIMGFHTWRV